jgi:[acyl-carrier-protein] S-malonyltransferase
MVKYQKVAFLFPGQGAQYPGMGKDFVENFSAAKHLLEEADELLKIRLSGLILNGPESTLMETRNSQLAIFVTSQALLRVTSSLFPSLIPSVCAGLSLGEYTALTAAQSLPFQTALTLVRHRADFMNEACEKTKGTMAVILGLEAATVAEMVQALHLPHDLWVANFNCPGQVVISGTMKGIEAGTAAAKARGAKRILPLQVHGAFHSGLMRMAEEKLAPYILQAPLEKGEAELVMNVPGDFVSDLNHKRQCLIKQVTHSVRWEQGIRAMQRIGVDCFVEFGPGKTLSGMNKKIGVAAPTFNVEKVEDLDVLAKEMELT